ncbi:MAG: hypothetical protein N2327_08830, partial [Caldimicrobium sp.]|nr:hypothetical protein [Caldimicrobium sp.]
MKGILSLCLVLAILLSKMVPLTFAKDIAVIMSFPASQKKLNTMRKAAEEVGITIKPLYLGRLTANIQELMKLAHSVELPRADIYLFDIPQEEIRRLITPYLEKMLAGKEFYILNEPELGTRKDIAKILHEYFESGGKRNFKNLF